MGTEATLGEVKTDLESNPNAPRLREADGPENRVLSPQIQIEEKKKEEVVAWLVDEITRAKSDRASGLDAMLVQWEKDYEAKPRELRKTFPWDGASNIVVPVIATAVDAVLARLLNSIFGGKYLWHATAKAANWADLAVPMDKWLDWVQREVMDMYKVSQKWFLSTLKFGTGLLKLPWRQRLRNVVYMDNGNIVKEVVVLHDGPEPEVMALSDTLWSNDAIHTGLQNCSWVAHRTTLTWKDLIERQFSGDYYDVARIKTQTRNQVSEMELQAEEEMGQTPSQRDDYEVWEVYCTYDLESSEDQSAATPSVLSELIVTLELETKTALRAVYNFYRHQERPIHAITHMPRDNSMLGIGLCQMLADIQEEVTGMHNRRLDNATIANTKIWKRLATSNVKEIDIYPGAIIDVDQMDELDVMDMGDSHDTLLKEEIHSNAIGEKRTGVSDYTVGRESAAIGSRATATSTLALIREGNIRFKMTIKGIREALRNIAHQVIMLYQQFAPEMKVTYELFSEKEQKIVQEFMNLPPENSRASVMMDVPALSETANKEIDQQTYISLMQLFEKFYTGLVQAVSLTVQPGTPEPIRQLGIHAATSGAKMWERVLEAFDIADAENFVPNIEAMLGIDAGLEAMNGSANGQFPGEQGPITAGAGGNPAVGPAQAVPGMASPSQAPGQAAPSMQRPSPQGPGGGGVQLGPTNGGPGRGF